MTDNNKKPTYEALNEQDSLMDIGQQARSIAEIRDYRGDKKQAWTHPYTTDAEGAYRALKRNEIRKGAADEHLKNCRTYWANLTSDDVPQTKYTYDDKNLKWTPEVEDAEGKEFDIRPKGVKDYPSPNPADFNDDEHWKVEDDPTPSDKKVVDLDEGGKK